MTEWKKKPPKTGRESWDVDETRFFLRLVHEKKVLKSLDGKRFRADDIFDHLGPRMQDHGYLKTAKQMQTKFKSLREKYRSVMKVLDTSGSDSRIKKKFIFFEEMHALLSDCPVQNLEAQEESGIDSSDGQANDDVDEQLKSAYEGDNDEPPTEDDTSNLSVPRSDVSTETDETPATPTTPINATQKRVSRPAKRTYQQTVDAFAETTKANLLEVQSSLLEKQHKLLKDALQQQHDWESTLFREMLSSQRTMLQEFTTSLLGGLQTLNQPPFYGGPVPSYVGAGPSYGGAGPSYGGAGPSYGGAGPSYGGAGPSYGGAGPSYGGAGPSYGGAGPSYGGAGPSYGGAGPSYGGAGPSYSGPGYVYGAPGQSLPGPPSTDEQGPSNNHPGPSPSVSQASAPVIQMEMQQTSDLPSASQLACSSQQSNQLNYKED